MARKLPVSSPPAVGDMAIKILHLAMLLSCCAVIGSAQVLPSSLIVFQVPARIVQGGGYLKKSVNRHARSLLKDDLVWS